MDLFWDRRKRCMSAAARGIPMAFDQ